MIELWQLPLLFATGLAAGFVDSIAGGGGLIALPVLLSCGLDPRHALGTSKLQSTFGSGSAAWHYARAGTVDLKDCTRGFALSIVGAALGALAVQSLDPSFLRRAIPMLLIAVALYSLLRPELGSTDLHPRLGRVTFDLTFVLGIAGYDGFFGPGAGTFWTMAFVLMLGFNLTRATGYTKVMNFGSNLSALTLFLLAGQVVFSAGLAMGVGQLLGARLGSRMVVRRGTEFIRPVFISVVLALTAKLLYDAYGKQVNKGAPMKTLLFGGTKSEGMATDSREPAGIYFGTNTGKLFGSRDEGDSWQVIADNLPPMYSVATATI